MSDFVRPILTAPDGAKKVLLHSCCAPCSGEVMEAMLASGVGQGDFHDLFAFPLQQCVAYWGVRSPIGMFAIMVPLVLFAAFLSWTLVEKPLLNLKSRTFTDFDPAYTAPMPKREAAQSAVSMD